MQKARAIAFYLPQFHPIPENDEWWGRGFTEWTNTAKARPMFPGHYQPHVPADLGFYDLRLPESRAAQAALAHEYGIEGFCYYHYWFAGRQILEQPLQAVIASGQPDFPFCVCWANETWSGIWHGAPSRILIEQTYPGEADERAHFATLLPAFRDRRYIRVHGKPLLAIYRPLKLPDPRAFVRRWRRMAADAGLDGLHMIGWSTSAGDPVLEAEFDGVIRGPDFKQREWVRGWQDPVRRVRQTLRGRLGLPHIYSYATFVAQNEPRQEAAAAYPCVVHAWDNTPRSGRNGLVYVNPDPQLYGKLLRAAIKTVVKRPFEERLIFLKSWNEWAEGNHLEPDLRYGKAYLQAVYAALNDP